MGGLRVVVQWVGGWYLRLLVQVQQWGSQQPVAAIGGSAVENGSALLTRQVEENFRVCCSSSALRKPCLNRVLRCWAKRPLQEWRLCLLEPAFRRRGGTVARFLVQAERFPERGACRDP